MCANLDGNMDLHPAGTTWIRDPHRSKPYRKFNISWIVSTPTHTTSIRSILNNSRSNESTLTPHSFNSPRSDIDLDLELSYRPSVTFVVAVKAPLDIADASISLTVDLDVPKLDVDMNEVHNVTATCDPATPSTPTDQVFRNATLVVPSVGLDAIEIFSENGSFLGLQLLSADQTLEQSDSFNLTTGCYSFDKANKTLSLAHDTKSSLSLATAGVRAPLAMALLTMIMVGLVQM